MSDFPTSSFSNFLLYLIGERIEFTIGRVIFRMDAIFRKVVLDSLFGCLLLPFLLGFVGTCCGGRTCSQGLRDTGVIGSKPQLIETCFTSIRNIPVLRFIEIAINPIFLDIILDSTYGSSYIFYVLFSICLSVFYFLHMNFFALCREEACIRGNAISVI